MILSESEKENIRLLHEKYKKSPFYTAQSFNMGDMSDIQKNIEDSVNSRATKVTMELSGIFDDVAKKEGRLVVEKVLLNLLEKYQKPVFNQL